jgi:hypothetical protein
MKAVKVIRDQVRSPQFGRTFYLLGCPQNRLVRGGVLLVTGQHQQQHTDERECDPERAPEDHASTPLCKIDRATHEFILDFVGGSPVAGGFVAKTRKAVVVAEVGQRVGDLTALGRLLRSSRKGNAPSTRAAERRCRVGDSPGNHQE